MSENQKYAHRKKVMEKYKISKLLFIIKKNELNENRFFLRAEILIKIKIRDKKKLTKKSHGRQFSGRQFSWETIFWGAIFQGVFFQEEFFREYFSRTLDLIYFIQ